MKGPTRILSISALALVVLSMSSVALAADRSDTKLVAILNNKLYTIARTGTLSVSDLTTGKETGIGVTEFGKIQYFFAGTSSLFGLDEAGSLFSISAADGTMTSLGKTVETSIPFVATMLGDTVYAIDREGVLFETNTKAPRPKRIGQGFTQVKFLWGGTDRLYAIAFSGSLLSIDLAGRSNQVGASADWLGTLHGTFFRGKLYTKEGGTLFETDPQSGIWRQLGKNEFISTKVLFGSGSTLYGMDFNGALFKVDLATGVRTNIP